MQWILAFYYLEYNNAFPKLVSRVARSAKITTTTVSGTAMKTTQEKDQMPLISAYITV